MSSIYSGKVVFSRVPNTTPAPSESKIKVDRFMAENASQIAF